MPGAWVLSGSAPLLDAAGHMVTREQISGCLTGGELDKDTACVASKNLHYSILYQPANRYWTFQWIEFLAYLVLAGLLSGFAFWRIPRGIS